MTQIAILPGDGIGPEIAQQSIKVLDTIKKIFDIPLEWEIGLIGGAAYDQTQTPLPEATLKLCDEADAVLLGAVGGPQYENIARELRPERGLLGLRTHLNAFANLRPAILYPELVASSSLKEEVISGLDIMIVRELTGGIYFGKPRGIETLDNGERKGYNTLTYTESEIIRIAKIAFETAQKRNKKLCSVDKANVLETSELWREIFITEAKNYPEIELSHMYVDNAAMQLVRYPKQFDVIATDNMFGDILSDQASMLTGSIGMLPSASLNEKNKGLYEPIHGSAPDIAGKDIANPIAMILSIAMLLRYSANQENIAQAIEQAIRKVLAKGIRTKDIACDTCEQVGTQAMGDAIINILKEQA